MNFKMKMNIVHHDENLEKKLLYIMVKISRTGCSGDSEAIATNVGIMKRGDKQALVGISMTQGWILNQIV